MFKIGAFTFGGGYAMIPIMQEEFVARKGWVKDEDILDIFAIAQSMPGVIALNTSTFVGYRLAGVRGGLIAAIGIILPSFIIISVLSSIYLLFNTNPYVAAAFQGVRACVATLIIRAAYNMAKAGIKNWFGIVVAAIGFVLVALLQVNTIFVIIGAGIVGYLYGGRGK